MFDSPLMLVKLLLIVGGIGAFTWWQLRDLAREKERSQAQEKLRPPAAPDDKASGP